jgi:peptidoglycan/LPS O-acetylase OafA/YrhL
VAAAVLTYLWPAIAGLTAFSLVIFAVTWYGGAGVAGAWARLGRLTYGVYLVHLVFLELIVRWQPETLRANDVYAGLWRPAGVTVASFLAAAALYHFRPTRFLVA